jgi:hypothetical protein
MARKNRVQPGTPDAVVKAAKDAEELHKQVYGDPDSANNTDMGAEAPGGDGGEGGDIQPVETQTQPEPTGNTSEQPMAEGEATATEVTPPQSEPAENWEQKYKALKGKYDAEVPRMAADLREMRGQMDALVAAQQRAAEKPKEPAPKKDVVTEQDMTDYGEDLIAFIRKVADNAAEAAVNNLTPRLEQIQGQVVQSAQKQATNTVYSKLDADIQDWRDINKSAEFLDWLAQKDAFAGDYRKNLLARAFEDGDAERVAAFFKGFLAESQAVTPNPTAQGAPVAQVTPQPGQNSQTQVSLEQLAGPAGGPSAGNVNTQPEQAPSWTRAQIASFYKDVREGAFRNNPEQQARIEASIATAMAENRIV